MPRYTVYQDEVTTYALTVDADDEDEAINAFLVEIFKIAVPDSLDLEVESVSIHVEEVPE